jgi:hypothetical protein
MIWLILILNIIGARIISWGVAFLGRDISGFQPDCSLWPPLGLVVVLLGTMSQVRIYQAFSLFIVAWHQDLGRYPRF